MAGRPRKPLAEKEKKGRRKGQDSGGRALPKEPKYAKGLPAPPASLKAEGLKEWKRLGPKMTERGVLTEADWSVFYQYCDAVQRRFIVRKALAEAKVGSEEWHKMDRALNRVEKHLTTAQRELGLSPVTRSKAAMAPSEKNDPKDKFNRGKAGLSLVKGARR